LNCTPTIPTLSDALALTLTVPLTAAPFAGAVITAEGGALSGGGTEPPLRAVPMSVLISAADSGRL
jgi:hypothetical protein